MENGDSELGLIVQRTVETVIEIRLTQTPTGKYLWAFLLAVLYNSWWNELLLLGNDDAFFPFLDRLFVIHA